MQYIFAYRMELNIVLFIIISVVFGVLCAVFEGEIVDRLVRFLMFIIYFKGMIPSFLQPRFTMISLSFT